ncbi:hypothetical protein ACSFCK_10145, partial [Brevibacterium luteolum]|uniref:hypothetical protein n=1 Tax=Brevibacterium luteolum TaxID=199591 RepID=UPI003EF00135
MELSERKQVGLDRLRRDQSGKCWWCGGVGDSREHKHKASVLRKMWGEEGLLLGRDGAELWPVPSVKSKVAKFGKTLCQECNNVRSQQFDEAYDIFVQFVWDNNRHLNRAHSIDWRQVYDADWEVKTGDLARYLIKSFGCWIADSGFPPPQVFADFLNGGTLQDTALVIERQQSIS